MGFHDVAQVCANGHVITGRIQQSPNLGLKFCKKCGAPTITKCPACSEAIQGEYEVEGVLVLGFGMRTPPAFCHACGKAYPWTSARIEAAKAIADEIDELTTSEKLLLKASIDDIVTETPRTELGILRFKKYAVKGGKAVADAFRDILVDVASETAKKSIWG